MMQPVEGEDDFVPPFVQGQTMEDLPVEEANNDNNNAQEKEATSEMKHMTLVQLSQKMLMYHSHHQSAVFAICGKVSKSFDASSFQLNDRVVFLS